MIESDTRITYPEGTTTGSSTILHIAELGAGTFAVVLDETPAHPVDPTWPDQGPDVGTIEAQDAVLPLLDVRIGAWDGSELHVDDRLPARLGTDGWHFVVVHVVAASEALRVGADAAVRVDEEHRRSLSAGHTACHLAALALNDVLAGYWSKDARRDSLGSPDFDAAAIQRSVIRPFGSIDIYRLGKTLRKSGFQVDLALGRLPEIETHVNARLAEWVSTDAPVRIQRASHLLSERRFWICDLPHATATIPCGGTHLSHLAELGTVTVSFRPDESNAELTMTTVVTPAG
jgi:alanyl-tRNA synthetase